jgi:hypothetical protein
VVSPVALAFAEAGLPIFPVRLRREGERLLKEPCIAEWQRRASADPHVIAGWWSGWPDALPAVPLARCGLVVVDADRHGRGDGVATFTALGDFPPHPVVATPRAGEHHYFAQPLPPVASFIGWADGIDVLGTGRFVVGYAVPEGTPPILPEVFRKRRLNDWVDRRERSKGNERQGEGDGAEVANLVEALAKLDPREFRNFDRWLTLMLGCKGAGIARGEFVAWSTADPEYADAGAGIARIWEGLNPSHGGSLGAELKRAGIKVGRPDQHRTSQSSSLSAVRSAIPKPYVVPRTLNFHARLERARGQLQRARGAGRERALFDCACVLAEMTFEGRLKVDVARHLLQADCETNRLWQENRGGCEITIGNAVRGIELKMLGERE